MQMKLSKERIMRKLLAIGTAVGILIACSLYDAYSRAKSVEFLFAEDNQIEQLSEQDEASIEPKAPVPADKWLNEPLTRLDYVLTKIEATLKENCFPIKKGGSIWALTFIARESQGSR